MSEFSTTLEGFGYAFNDAGQLRKIDSNDGSITDIPFKFEEYDDARQNQAHYEALGEVITEHVYKMLVEEAGLHKIYLPSPESPTSSFVFGTKTNFKDTKKLLLLIHGSGVVRAGQWSRSLIINQSINHGTQVPYIKRAIELGFDVLVTNTNHNDYIANGERFVLQGNRSPEEHILTVWEELIAPVFDTIDSFAVVAHSYGGVVTLKMARTHPGAFLKKCFAIGFTDSVHYAGGLTDDLFAWVKENARNYVTSTKPLGTELRSGSRDMPSFSAGHIKHEWTSWACMEDLFPFLERRYEEFLATQEQIKKIKLSNDTKTEGEGNDSNGDDNVEDDDSNGDDNVEKSDGKTEKSDGDGKAEEEGKNEEGESKKPEETDEGSEKPESPIETEEISDKPEEIEKHEIEKTEKHQDL